MCVQFLKKSVLNFGPHCVYLRRLTSRRRNVNCLTQQWINPSLPTFPVLAILGCHWT
jgi:hypothetical protein